METLHPREIELGLERAATVSRNLGLTTPPFPVITVGGTNGKGSVAAMLEQILHAAGYRVGLYTSPHLIRYNERVRIRGRELTDAELTAGFERVEAARGATPLTYFEFGTLAAVERFLDAGVEVAILEVGLGGRLDVVNVWDADVAIVASVGTDHKDWLGPDRESIGREKAGIYRAGRCAICGDADPPASLIAQATAIGARLLRIHQEFDFERRDGGWLWRAAVPGSANAAGGTSAGMREVEQGREQLPGMPGAAGTRLYAGLPHPAMRGDYQLANAACVLMALDCLADRLPVTLADIRAGLTRAILPGRFQTLPGRPLRVFDVAHNAEAAQALARTLASQPVAGRTIAVCGMLRDKPLTEVVGTLAPQIHAWHIAGLEGARAASADDLRAALGAAGVRTSVTEYTDIVAAYRAAEARAGEDDRVLVFGSFHTVGAILRALSTP